MHNKNFLALFSFILSILSAHACTCAPFTLQSSYFNSDTARVVKATPVQQMISISNQEVTYKLQLQHEYKACPPYPKTVSVTTSIQSAACGVSLQLNTPYIIALNSLSSTTTIGLCQYVKKYNMLTDIERNFLDTRQICCGTRCFCANGMPRRLCRRLPCQNIEPPCKDAVNCIDNFCNDCAIEWLDAEGQLTCLRIPVLKVTNEQQ